MGEDCLISQIGKYLVDLLLVFSIGDNIDEGVVCSGHHSIETR